jgi:hypothetical protein
MAGGALSHHQWLPSSSPSHVPSAEPLAGGAWRLLRAVFPCCLALLRVAMTCWQVIRFRSKRISST